MSGSELHPVSVVIPTYNRAKLLNRAIDSALAAILPGDEVIVVDDASTDNTRELMLSYGDRIRAIFAPHGGAGATRNRGIREARNPLVAFLDSDDAWIPDHIALQRTLMSRRPELVMTFSDFMVIDRGREYHNYLSRWHQDARSWDQILAPGVDYSTIAPLPSSRSEFKVHIGSIYASLMHALYVSTFTLMVRSKRAGDQFYFPVDLPLYEDWECYARVARCGLVAYLDCETSINYGHPGPRLTDADDYISADTRLKVLERLWGQDSEFLRDNRDKYLSVVTEMRLTKARWLLSHGRRHEAREVLRQVVDTPITYRLLAAMPGRLGSGLLSLRRMLRGTKRNNGGIREDVITLSGDINSPIQGATS